MLPVGPGPDVMCSTPIPGHLRPVLDRTCAIDDLIDAYEYVESGQKLGTVVVVLA